MSDCERKPKAVLLLGPTGVGKTPLGEILEARGLYQQRCVHFDFGENLRRTAAADSHQRGLTADELEVARDSLRTGALLENEHFIIAEKILRGFLAERHGNELVVLNGLPRHVGQAAAIDAIVQIEAVIYLECSPETVFERIRTNAGGDRSGRADDDIDAIRRKLTIFDQRTSPLLEHYRSGGADVRIVEVTAVSTAEDIWQRLNRDD